MTSSAHELLIEKLEQTFSSGQLRLVPIFGAGLHHHLRSHAEQGHDSSAEWMHYCNWNGLLASIGKESNLAQIQHKDPTSTWESIVTRYAYSKKKSAGMCEIELLEKLAQKLEAHPGKKNLVRLGRFLKFRFADIITLNFDRSLDIALSGKETESSSANSDGMLKFEGESGFARIWYAHGHISKPKELQLGQRTYGMSIEKLENLRRDFKKDEKVWLGKNNTTLDHSNYLNWEHDRRSKSQDAGKLNWVDLFLFSNLAFVGCSLDRAETDL